VPKCIYCNDEPFPGGRSCPFCGPEAVAVAGARTAAGGSTVGESRGSSAGSGGEQPRSRPPGFCTQCGQSRSEGDKYCAGCGSPIHPGTATATGLNLGPTGDLDPGRARVRAASQAGASNQYAWALALAPLALLAIDSALALGGYVEVAGFVVFGVALLINTLGGIWDTHALREQGRRPPSAVLCALLVPAYLVVRAKRLPGTWLVPVVWLVTALVYFGGASYAENHAPVRIDGSQVEAAGDDRLGELDMQGTVSCPDEVKKAVGETFTCSVIGNEMTNVMEVRVEDVSGGFTFHFS
jgi:hypothetical protein